MPKYCDVKKLVADTKAGRWWEKVDNKKDGPKWNTLYHNGIKFPDPYKPLPSNVRLLYNGKPVKLNATNLDNKFNVSAEEAAVFFANKLNQDVRLKSKRVEKKGAMDDPVFKKNFWNDWKKILGPKHIIKSLNGVNFKPMMEFLQKRSDQKKADRKTWSKERKQEEKKEKEIIKEIYGYAIVDGVRIPISGYSPQPPGLYIGHGKVPLKGKIKARIKPEDITLNVSLNAIPKCMNNGKPCKWGEVVEDKNVTWIASYKHPVKGGKAYVWLDRNESHWVCMDDKNKFEKARKLEKNISKIRSRYKKDLTNPSRETRQLATAVYLLDELAIRPGTDKDEKKEANTMGLTTLKCGNITFKAGNTITINFTGKSSIKFKRTVVIHPRAYQIMKQICGKSKTTPLFPDVSATSLNSYLKTLLPGLTSKVFRTWKASSIFQKQLNQHIPPITDQTYEKKIVYNNVNIEVAKALNHKRMADNQERVNKLEAKIEELENKKKEAKTEAVKKRIQKSITLNRSKLDEAKHNIATSTSKVNYLDPRITVSWAKKCEVPIEKLYNKTQLKKFVWAMETDQNWDFNKYK